MHVLIPPLALSIVSTDLQECAHVLLEGTPRNADLPRLRKELLKVGEWLRGSKHSRHDEYNIGCWISSRNLHRFDHR